MWKFAEGAQEVGPRILTEKLEAIQSHIGVSKGGYV